MNDKEKAETGQSIVRFSTGGVFSSVELLARAIKSLGEKHHLIVPGGAIGADLPLLHAAGISFVFIDPERETYSVGERDSGNVGLAKTALDRIAAAAGVRWNPHLCGRVDDSSNPYVVEYQAIGAVLQLDATERLIQASKRIDLRAEKDAPRDTWGPDSREIARIAEKKNRDPWPQILQQRQHILSLAESKAKNRAIRSLGVRTNYQLPELEKGFAVVRLQFTGRSEDPEIEHEVSLMLARRAISSTAMLYGGEASRSLPPAPLAAQKKVPKVVTVEDEQEDDPGSDQEKAATEPQAKPVVEEKRVSPKDDPALICGDQDEDGKWPRKGCSKFTAQELKAKIAAYEKKRPKWDPKWAAKNEADLRAMKAWLAYKEFDPRQDTIPGTGQDSDKVPF